MNGQRAAAGPRDLLATATGAPSRRCSGRGCRRLAARAWAAMPARGSRGAWRLPGGEAAAPRATPSIACRPPKFASWSPGCWCCGRRPRQLRARAREPRQPLRFASRRGPRIDHISESAKRGARLFVGKAGCIDCHSGSLFLRRRVPTTSACPRPARRCPPHADCAEGTACDCVAGKACLPWGAGRGHLAARSHHFTGWSWWPSSAIDPATAAAVAPPPPPTDESLKGALAQPPACGTWR
jgi:hypothetical protein